MAEVRKATPQETFNALAQFSDTKAANQAELNGRHIRLYKDADGQFKVTDVTKWELVVDAIREMLNSIGFNLTTFDRIDLHNNILTHLRAGTEIISVKSAEGVSNENLAKAVMALDALRDAQGKAIVNKEGIKIFTQLADDVRQVAIQRFGSEGALDEQIAQIERARTPDPADGYVVVDNPQEADRHWGRGSPVGEPTVRGDSGNLWSELERQAREIDEHGRSKSMEDPLLNEAKHGFLDLVLGQDHRKGVDNLDRLLYIIRAPEAAKDLLSKLEGKQTAAKRTVAEDEEVIELNKEIEAAEADSNVSVAEMCNKRIAIRSLETAFEGANPNWAKRQANAAKQRLNKKKIETLKAEVKELEEVTIPQKEANIQQMKRQRSEYVRRKESEVLQGHTRLTPNKFAAVLKNTRFIVDLHAQIRGRRSDLVHKALKIKAARGGTYERQILRHLVRGSVIAEYTQEEIRQKLTEVSQA